MAHILSEIDAPRAVVDEFRHGLQAQMALAAVAQAKLNALAAEAPAKMIDGVGELVARVDADVYWAMRHKFGPECWSDPGFRKACQKNELLRPIKSVSGKTTIAVNAAIRPPVTRRIELITKP